MIIDLLQLRQMQQARQVEGLDTDPEPYFRKRLQSQDLSPSANSSGSQSAHKDPEMPGITEILFPDAPEIHSQVTPPVLVFRTPSFDFSWIAGPDNELTFISSPDLGSACEALAESAVTCINIKQMELSINEDAVLFTETYPQLAPLQPTVDQGLACGILAAGDRLIGRYYQDGQWVYVYRDDNGRVYQVSMQDFDQWCTRLAAVAVEDMQDPPDIPDIAPEDYKRLTTGWALPGRQVPPNLVRNWIEHQGLQGCEQGCVYRFRQSPDTGAPPYLPSGHPAHSPQPLSLMDPPPTSSSDYSFSSLGTASTASRYTLTSSSVSWVGAWSQAHRSPQYPHSVPGAPPPSLADLTGRPDSALTPSDKRLVAEFLEKQLTGDEQLLLMQAMGADITRNWNYLLFYLNSKPVRLSLLALGLTAIGRYDLMRAPVEASSNQWEQVLPDMQRDSFWTRSSWQALEVSGSEALFISAREYFQARLVRLVHRHSKIVTPSLSSVLNTEFSFHIPPAPQLTSLDITSQILVQVESLCSSNREDYYYGAADTLINKLTRSLTNWQKIGILYNSSFNKVFDRGKLLAFLQQFSSHQLKTLAYLCHQDTLLTQDQMSAEDILVALVGSEKVHTGIFAIALYAVTGREVLIPELQALLVNQPPLYSFYDQYLTIPGWMLKQQISIPSEVRQGKSIPLVNMRTQAYLHFRYPENHHPSSTGQSHLAQTRDLLSTLAIGLYTSADDHEVIAQLSPRKAAIPKRPEAVFMTPTTNPGDLYSKIPITLWPHLRTGFCSKCQERLSDTGAITYLEWQNWHAVCPDCLDCLMVPLFSDSFSMSLPPLSTADHLFGGWHYHPMVPTTAIELIKKDQEAATKRYSYKLQKESVNSFIKITTITCQQCRMPRQYRPEDALFTCPTCYTHTSSTHEICGQCMQRYCAECHKEKHVKAKAGHLMEQYPGYHNGVYCDKCEAGIAAGRCEGEETTSATIMADIQSWLSHCPICNLDFCRSCVPLPPEYSCPDGDEDQPCGQSIPSGLQ